MSREEKGDGEELRWNRRGSGEARQTERECVHVRALEGEGLGVPSAEGDSTGIIMHGNAMNVSLIQTRGETLRGEGIVTSFIKQCFAQTGHYKDSQFQPRLERKTEIGCDHAGILATRGRRQAIDLDFQSM